MRQKIIFIIASLLLLNGCTRDDICAPDQAVTPLLIITFNNTLDREERKAVTNLVVTTDLNEITIANVASDSIAIPLSTTADDTRYRFMATNTNNIDVTDVLEFTYTREDTYINRACAFKTTYTNITATEDTQDEDNDAASWIRDIQINEQTVENELQSHITIFH